MPAAVFHPMVVHFPIALLVVALLIETLALILPRAGWHRVALWNLVLGTWGALLAVITGGIAAAGARPVLEESRNVLEMHGTIGTLAFALAAAVNGWHLAAGQQMSRRSRWIAWGFLVLTCGVLAYAAHLGARLVYEYGLAEMNLP